MFIFFSPLVLFVFALCLRPLWCLFCFSHSPASCVIANSARVKQNEVREGWGREGVIHTVHTFFLHKVGIFVSLLVFLRHATVRFSITNNRIENKQINK